MPLDVATFLAIAAACAPQVAPETLLAMARVESGLEPLAIGVNGPAPRGLRPARLEAAVANASALIAAGRSVDLGLAQINSRNLARLGLTPRTAFEPCRNLAAGARVLEAGYRRATPAPGQEQAALRTALSYYNTGHPSRGLRNGYVAKVAAAARGGMSASTERRPEAAIAPEPPAPAWDVFARARRGFVINASNGALP